MDEVERRCFLEGKVNKISDEVTTDEQLIDGVASWLMDGSKYQPVEHLEVAIYPQPVFSSIIV